MLQHLGLCRPERPLATPLGIPNFLNYFAIFRAHVKFTNVAAEIITRPGRVRVGHPWVRYSFRKMTGAAAEV
jgi:hypothetical protein